MLKPLLSFVVSFFLTAQPVFAGALDTFFCRQLLQNKNPDLIAELLTLKRFGRSAVEVLKVKEKGKKTVELNHVINPEYEVLFGWETKGVRPLLTLYFHNTEVRVGFYPWDERPDRRDIEFTIKEGSIVQRGVYFVAKFSPDKIAKAAAFVDFLKANERTWIEMNHTYTKEQKIADLDKLLSFFLIQALDGAKALKFNQGEVTHPVVVGDLTKSKIKERLTAMRLPGVIERIWPSFSKY